MNKEEAIKYLQRKKVDTTKENIDRVMREGKIYGDPLADIKM